ncbi:MAG TPA: flavin reductase family protein [Desulfomonilia bacterium]|nr:flavin reductase family protein [Desulfomonilia bacterium]
MEKQWQDVLDRFHYGIYLVTIAADGLYNGMIASWVAQCSHTPPLITLAIRKNRLSQSQIMQTGRFTINILARDALPLLNRFKVPDWKHKFDGIDYFLSEGGNPVLKDSLGYLDCMVERAIDAGDHSLFIGRITGGAMKNEGEALTTIHYPGRYRGDK